MSTLVIAAHGTRLADGQQACRALVARVRAMLPGVQVLDSYVELDIPTIAEAVAAGLAADADDHVVVVPLMLGTGGHVRDDIPEGIAAGRAEVGRGEVTYTAHLGPDPRLRAAARERIAAAAADWSAAETSVVFLGRGCSVPEANADHVRLGRLLLEEAGYADLVTGFIQVSQPDLGAALDRAYAHGGRRIVVLPHYLFPGRLQRWAQQQTDAWAQRHPDAEVRVADVLGDCDELAGVVVDRFREAVAARMGDAEGARWPVYLSGLLLRGRKVVVVGAGRVAARRVGKLLAAGAEVHVVAPAAVARIEELAAAGRLQWAARPVVEADLADAWYVLAASDDAAVNAEVAGWTEAQRCFCVRADDSAAGSAWTPATGLVNGLVVGAVGGKDPHRAAHARTAAVTAVAALEAGSRGH